MKRYVDIHNHHTPIADPDILAVHNLYGNFQMAEKMAICTIGVHPWYVDGFVLHIETIKRLAALPQVVGIGECGLDAVTETPMATQRDVFARQIAIANQANKPLIIHCVRAFAETIEMLKTATVPIVFHGFQKNAAMAQELITHGYYISFGAALLNTTKTNSIDSLISMPLDRVFLETDDSDVSIQTIYQAAAKHLNIEEDVLVTQIQKNYQTVFKK